MFQGDLAMWEKATGARIVRWKCSCLRRSCRYLFCAAPVLRGPGQVEALLQLPGGAAGQIRHDGPGAETGAGAAQGVSAHFHTAAMTS